VGALTHFLGEEQTRAFLKRLGDQNPYLYAQPAAGRSGLFSGEYDINMQGLTSAFVAMTQGEPAGVLALDPTSLSSNLIALFKQGKNPHSALLFIDWLLGEGAVVSSEVEGSWTPEEVEKRQKGELKLPKRIRVEQARDVDQLKTWMDLFQQLVVRK
jgi:ABC-type Fe3+ transport system substrate-binding protein